MKNKTKLLFAGILVAFLMLAVPFAVVTFDADDSDAAVTDINESYTTDLTAGDYKLVGDFTSVKTLNVSGPGTISIVADKETVLKGLVINVTSGVESIVVISGIESTESGIIVKNAKKVTITDCYVHDVGASGMKIAGNIVGIGADVSTDVEISNNTVRGIENTGIIAHCTTNDIKITNNTVSNVGNNGLWIKDAGGGKLASAVVDISGNSISEWGTSDFGRAIRANNVASTTVVNNDFSKNYNTPVVDIGNLFKTDFKDVDNGSTCKVVFSSNWSDDVLIPIDVSETIGIEEGIFFDAGSIFEDDSHSTVEIETGKYYWSDVTIAGHCVFPNGVTDRDADITVYGDLIIESDANLTAININMTEDSKLNNSGTLKFENISVSEGAGVYYMAGSKVTTGGETVTYRQDEKYDPLTGGAQASITVYLEGVNAYPYESEIEVFIGDLYSLPDVYVDAGYKFDGWYTEYGVKITESSRASADVTKLIAKAVYDIENDDYPSLGGAPVAEESEFDIADHIVLIEVVVAVLVLIGFVAYIRKN